jgi:predicted porin
MKMRLMVLVAVAVASMATADVASIISYDEAVSGDLDYSQNLAFGVGLNTVSGTILWSNGAVPSDFDGFNFSLDASSRLESVFIDIALQEDVGSGIWSFVGWELNFISDSVSIPSSNESLFESVLPLTEGTFAMFQSSASGSLASGDYRVADYTLSFNVAAIPEPASAAMIGLVSGCALFVRRRFMI